MPNAHHKNYTYGTDCPTLGRPVPQVRLEIQFRGL